MENLAHSLTGLALAKGGLENRVPFGSLILIAAANAPDADVIMTLGGPLDYLHYHRGITHSVLGTLLLGLALGLAAFAFRRFSKVPKATLFDCIWVAELGALTHPLLDLTNSYGLRPFLPFSDVRYCGDLFFIVDPYLWLLLGVPLFLAVPWKRWAFVLWGAGLTLDILISVLAAPIVPAMKTYLWVLLVVAAFTVWFRRRRGPLGPWAARSAIALMTGYWLLLGGLHHLALGQVSRELDARQWHDLSAEPAALPKPADPTSWDTFFERDGQIYTAIARSLKAGLDDMQTHNPNLDREEVKAALQTCPGQVLAHFGRFVTYRVDQTEDGPDVVFRDLRFSRVGDSGFGTYRMRLRPDLSGLRTESHCPAPDSYLP